MEVPFLLLSCWRQATITKGSTFQFLWFLAAMQKQIGEPAHKFHSFFGVAEKGMKKKCSSTLPQAKVCETITRL
jgi:hypothetical protein